MKNGMDSLMTVRELSEYLKLAPLTVYRMVDRGELPAYKLGKHLRFEKKEIERFLKERKGGVS